MDLVGKRVNHNKFGEGLITKNDLVYISVKFDAEKEVKRFTYPSCFKTFLKLLDDAAADAIEKDVRQHENQLEEKEKQKKEVTYSYDHTIHEHSQKIVRTQEFNTVENFCCEYKKELNSEIAYLRSTGGKRQTIYDGKCVEVNHGHYVYTFESEDELKYPEGTQVSIWQGQISVLGTIIGSEDFTIIIATSVNLGVDVPYLEFSAEPWRLLSALQDRLDEICTHPSEIVHSLICDGHNSVEYSNHKITTGQNQAVYMSQVQPITFVWGPPGTGKTQTLAKIALEHIRKSHRVLMLSYSNVSVDEAIMRVYQLASEKKAGILVRYGYARRDELLEHEYLTAYNLAIHNHPELMKERTELIKERKMVSRASQRYVQIGRRLTEIKNTLIIEEKEALKSAKFVATTVSKAIVDNAVREKQFDVVIFDEASMAYIPQIIFSASLAKQNFICMGDFRQLPPIVQNRGSSHLNADIFQYCGITAAVDNKCNHKWLCMLDTQYRMHPLISDFVSNSMYGGLLKSAEEMTDKRTEISDSSPIRGAAVAVADLSGMMSVCTKTTDNSRVNVLSAIISFGLALRAAKKYEVGIITPYHAQSRLLHAMAQDAADADLEMKQISCATVHQFQGSEKDIIIFDAVDCYRMTYPGILLTSTANNYANRLFNVAVTRAKGKFIGVINAAYMNNKNLSKELMMGRLLQSQMRKSSCIEAPTLISKIDPDAEDMFGFYSAKRGNRRIIENIRDARREIRIDIPDKPIDDSFIDLLVSELKEAKHRGIKIYLRSENKNNLPLLLKGMAIENFCVVNPIVIIDKKIVWFGMPRSDAKFITEGHILQTKYHPIIRIDGVHTAKALYSFMQMGKTVDQSKAVCKDSEGNPITDTFSSYILANQECPSCGKAMKLQKSRNGKFFMACTNYPLCNKTMLVDVDLIEKYICRNGGAGQLCPRCNRSLEAKAGPYGVYIQCCGIMQHKYKMDEI